MTKFHLTLMLCLLATGDALAGGATQSTTEPNVLRDRACAANNTGCELTQNRVRSDLHVLHPGWDLTAPSYLPETPEMVYFNTTSSNHQLLVFLPGCGATPDKAQQFMLRAAGKGYHVIGLMYWNDCATPSCDGVTDQDRDACMRDFRAVQYSNGASLPAALAVGSGASLVPQDSVRHRLRRLLDYLDATFPNQHWGQFAIDGQGGFDNDGYLDWTKVVLSAHSEGTKVGAYIAAHEALAKAMFFSGPNEHVNKQPNASGPRWTTPSAFKFQSGIPHINPRHLYFFWSEQDDNATDNTEPGYDGGLVGDVTNDVDYLNAKAMRAFTAPNNSEAWSVDELWGYSYVGPFVPTAGDGYHALYAEELPPWAGSCGAHQSTVMDCGVNHDELLYQPIIDWLLAE